MADRNIVRFSATALVLFAATIALPMELLEAQRRGRYTIPPDVITNLLKPVPLPCCRCLDGESTSVAVSTGSAPWWVTAPGSSANAPSGLVSNAAWTQVLPGQWIGPAGAEMSGDYTYEMPFSVSNCVIPMQITISGKFAADNTAKLYVDSTLVKASQGTAGYGFLPGSVTPFTWSGSLAPGPHSLRVVVTNSSGPTGLVVAANITVTCSKELERKD